MCIHLQKCSWTKYVELKLLNYVSLQFHLQTSSTEGKKPKKTKSVDFGLTLNEVMQSWSIIIGVLNGNPEPQHYQNARNNCNYSQFIITIVNINFWDEDIDFFCRVSQAGCSKGQSQGLEYQQGANIHKNCLKLQSTSRKETHFFIFWDNFLYFVPEGHVEAAYQQPSLA